MTEIMASVTIKLEWNQSKSLPLSNSICKQPMPITNRIRPITSIGIFVITVSRLARRIVVNITEKMPTGTLI